MPSNKIRQQLQSARCFSFPSLIVVTLDVVPLCGFSQLFLP